VPHTLKLTPWHLSGLAVTQIVVVVNFTHIFDKFVVSRRILVQFLHKMNKLVFGVVLLGLIVLATAAETKYPSKEKMRMKKEKAMAKKERAGLEKRKDIKMREGVKRMEAMAGKATGDERRRGKDEISRAYAALKQELVERKITPDQFKEQARLIKDQAKRELTGGSRKETARKDKGRNKRAAKEENMKLRRSAKNFNLNKSGKKSRRGQ